MEREKRILMIIASENFQDLEYRKPREILEGAGVEIRVASSSHGEKMGVLGMKVLPDLRLDQVNINDFDGIVFVGGPGAVEYFDSPEAFDLVRDAQSSSKILAAICIAPSILANAGVLKGKRVTCFPSESANLEKKGAIYTATDLEVDGKIITGSGPQAAEEFGKAILKAIGQ